MTTSRTGSTPHKRDPLRALARELGVQLSFTRTDGIRQHVKTEQLLEIVRGLGVDITSPTDAEGLLAVHQRARRTELLDQVTVLRAEEPSSIALGETAPRGVRVAIELRTEDGTEHSWAGTVTDEGRVELVALPFGVHELEIILGDRRARSTLLVAPTPPIPGAVQWGIGAPLYSIYRDEGPGPVFADLGRVASLGTRHGASLVGTLPLLATKVAGSGMPCPYLPSTRRFWETCYVDLSELGDLLEGDRALDRALARWRAGGGPAADRHVPLERQQRLVDDVLLHAAAILEERPGALGSMDLDEEADSLRDRFATYEARVQDRADPRVATRASLLGQALARRQIAAVAEQCPLYLDLPVGVHPDGFDALDERDGFVASMRFGAPPDEVFEGGQNWSCAPPSPSAMRADGYRYLRQCIAHVAAPAGVLRVDHVMGLERLYWIPPDSSPHEGAYVHYRTDELFAAVAIEAARAGTVVVGEDLGTVSPTLRAAMRRHGVLSSMVFQFEHAEPATPRPHTLASLGTHDLMPFASFLEGRDLFERTVRAQGEASVETAWMERTNLREHLGARGPMPLTDEEVERALIAALGQLRRRAPSLVMIDVEDLLAEREPQNRPGTPIEDGNFSRQMAESIDRLELDQRLDELLRRIGELVVRHEGAVS